MTNPELTTLEKLVAVDRWLDRKFPELFLTLSNKWKEETILLSSVDEIIKNYSYQQIIEMGDHSAHINELVVTLILADLTNNGPNHWFTALTLITGENPITEDIAGDMEKMTQAWLNWGKENGYE